MIKIFGKERYHWQPELSLAVIYWSMALIPALLSLILIFEHSRATKLIFGGFIITLMMTGLGCRRYFTIGQTDQLTISDFNPLNKTSLPISSITKLEISKYRLSLWLTGGKKKTVFMRKWPKKYFIDALVIHPDFRGEVELNDNLTRVDYFERYRKEKRPLVKN